MRFHPAVILLSFLATSCNPGEQGGSDTNTTALTIDSMDAVDVADLKVVDWGKPLGARPANEIQNYLTAIGDSAAFSTLDKGPPPPWRHTDHAFGFIPISAAAKVPLSHAGNIAPDQTLKNSQIRVTLDRLRVLDYPGGGEHKILVEFYGQNQVKGETEHVRFAQYYKAREAGGAGVTGYPVFLGLNVGASGAAFRVRTVNVENDNTRNFLNFLDSDIAKQGLKFVGGLNPAVPMLSGFVLGVTKMVASSKNNMEVQNAELGLDFTANATGARLSQGSYVVVQVAHAGDIDWSKWEYVAADGVIRATDPPHGDLPYNYIIFRVTKYTP